MFGVNLGRQSGTKAESHILLLGSTSFGFLGAINDFKQGNNMTKDELLEAMRNKPATGEDIKDFEKRLREREDQFEWESRNQTPDSEWYERRYTY